MSIRFDTSRPALRIAAFTSALLAAVCSGTEARAQAPITPSLDTEQQAPLALEKQGLIELAQIGRAHV